MAGKVKIDGVYHDINGGKVLINGVSHDINGGKANINGTPYDIPFSPVPPAYRQVDYIISKGTDYIISPITYQKDLKIETTIYFPKPGSGNYNEYLCAMVSESSSSRFNYYGRQWYSSGDDRTSGFFQYVSSGGTAITLDDPMPSNATVPRAGKLILDVGYPSQRRASMKMGSGTNDGPLNSQYNNYDNSNISLFKRTSNLLTKGGFGQITAYINDEPIIDLYPCVRRSDNMPGFYDAINYQFYYGTNGASGFEGI